MIWLYVLRFASSQVIRYKTYIYIHVVWVVVQDFVEEFVQTSTDIQNTWNNTAVFGCVISHRCGNVVWERSFGIFCATVVQHAFALRVERREHSQFVFKWFQRAIWDLFEQLVLKPYPQSQSRSIGLCHCTPLAGCGAGWHISCLPPVVYLALQREFHTLVDHSSFGLLVRSSKTLRPTHVVPALTRHECRTFSGFLMTCGGVPVDDRETNGLMCSLGFLLRCSFARVDCKQIARDDAALKGEANPGSNAQQTPQGHLRVSHWLLRAQIFNWTRKWPLWLKFFDGCIVYGCHLVGTAPPTAALFWHILNPKPGRWGRWFCRRSSGNCSGALTGSTWRVSSEIMERWMIGRNDIQWSTFHVENQWIFIHWSMIFNVWYSSEPLQILKWIRLQVADFETGQWWDDLLKSTSVQLSSLLVWCLLVW